MRNVMTFTTRPPDREVSHKIRTGDVNLVALFQNGFGGVDVARNVDVLLAQFRRTAPVQVDLIGVWRMPLAAANAATRMINQHFEVHEQPGTHGSVWFPCTPQRLLKVCKFIVLEVLTGYRDKELDAKTIPVVTPDGTFESAAAAAEHYGISRQAAHARATKRSGGWRFET